MEEDRFVALHRAHLDDVWRFARRRTTSAADADDATAEAFAVAWRRRDDLPAGDAARLWLLATTRRVLANQHRATRRRRGLTTRLTSVAPAPGPADPAEEALRSEDPLWAALASLPDEQRDLLIMRAWDGLAVGEIAQLLGCSPNAASIRLTRARGALDGALKDPRPRRTPSRPDPDAEEGR